MSTKRERATQAADEVANGIRHLREHRGLTQLGLAERMGVTQSLVSRWEDPTYRGWTVKTLVKIGIALRARVRIRLEEPPSTPAADRSSEKRGQENEELARGETRGDQ